MEEADEEKESSTTNLIDDEFLKKWAAPLLLGPFIPAMYALLIIVVGSIILNGAGGTCGFYLQGGCRFLHLFYEYTEFYSIRIVDRGDSTQLLFSPTILLGIFG